jgi:hypothetical protein
MKERGSKSRKTNKLSQNCQFITGELRWRGNKRGREETLQTAIAKGGKATGWEKRRIREISPADDDHQSWGAHYDRSSEEENMKGWKSKLIVEWNGEEWWTEDSSKTVN